MNLSILAAISAPTAGLVIALIALYRAKAQQLVDRAQQKHLEADLNKRVANRRIMLERWADEIHRYIRQWRDYLLERAKVGAICPHCAKHIDNVIDVDKLNMSVFIPPPMPTINGDT